jgi:two-component system, chemotaxis family, response regulator Rcp1
VCTVNVRWLTHKKIRKISSCYSTHSTIAEEAGTLNLGYTQMHLGPLARKPLILLVEDNAADAWLFQDLLSRTGVDHELNVIDDGEDAIEFLLKGAQTDWESLPDLILLDLNLPRKTGIEILKESKAHPALRLIPVLVLTSSGSERDINGAYASGANAYFRKPGGLTKVEELIDLIVRCWLQFASLPAKNAIPAR